MTDAVSLFTVLVTALNLIILIISAGLSLINLRLQRRRSTAEELMKAYQSEQLSERFRAVMLLTHSKARKTDKTKQLVTQMIDDIAALETNSDNDTQHANFTPTEHSKSGVSDKLERPR